MLCVLLSTEQRLACNLYPTASVALGMEMTFLSLGPILFCQWAICPKKIALCICNIITFVWAAIVLAYVKVIYAQIKWS